MRKKTTRAVQDWRLFFSRLFLAQDGIFAHYYTMYRVGFNSRTILLYRTRVSVQYRTYRHGSIDRSYSLHRGARRCFAYGTFGGARHACTSLVHLSIHNRRPPLPCPPPWPHAPYRLYIGYIVDATGR